MIVVDASLWVAYSFPPDQFHMESRRWIYRQIHSGERLASPNLLLAEVGGAVARRSGNSVIAERAWRGIMAIPLVQLATLDGPLAERAARLAGDYRIRGADAVYVALAEQLGVSLVTWDDDQRTRASAVVPAHTPLTFLVR